MESELQKPTREGVAPCGSPVKAINIAYTQQNKVGRGQVRANGHRESCEETVFINNQSLSALQVVTRLK